MADSEALRAQRSRNHRIGDHSLCHPARCPSAQDSQGVEPILLVPTEPLEGEEPLVASYRAVLEAANRKSSPEGAHVLFLAELLATGRHAASGAAALSRELRAAMDMALQGAPRKADELDELAARRDRKVGGA